MAKEPADLYYSDNPLVQHIVNYLYQEWQNDRQALLEPKWNKNRALYSKDTEAFDQYAGVWRAYHEEEDAISHEEEFFKADIVKRKRNWRSRTFLDIGKQKIVAGANLVNDVVFKGNKIPFQFDMYLPNGELDNEVFKVMSDHRDKISRQLVEMLQKTSAVGEMRRMVRSGAIYGEGYLKRKLEEVEFRSSSDLEIKEYLSAECVSVWDIFRDLQYDDVRKGDGLIQRKFVSIADLRDMQEEGEDSYYIPEALEVLIRDLSDNQDKHSELSATPLDISNTEGVQPKLRDIQNYSAPYEYLECWVRVPKHKAVEFAKFLESDGVTKVNREDTEDNSQFIHVLCGICNNTVVRFSPINPDDIPFYIFVWEEDADGVSGVGVADNIEACQIVINGLIRSIEDNKKLSSDVIFATKKRLLGENYGGFEPGKDIEISEEAQTISDAIEQFIVQDTTGPSMQFLDFMLQMGDMSSNVPRAQHGMPTGNPQTAFEVSQQLERSGKYIGSVITGLDDNVLERYLNDCYEWMSLQEDFDDMGIAFRVNAEGFSSYEAKAIRLQGLMATMSLVAQNEKMMNRVHEDYFLTEISKSNGIPAEEFVKTDEQMAEEAERVANSPETQLQQRSMALTVEKLSAEVDKLKSEINLNNAKAGEADANTDATDLETADAQTNVEVTEPTESEVAETVTSTNIQ